MNINHINDEEFLREFLNPQKITNAPEGFTTKAMTRILIESQSVAKRKSLLSRYRVPVISAVITLALVTAAVLIPAGNEGTVGSTVWSYFRDLEFALPDIAIPVLPELAIPEWFSYALIGVFLFGLFDRALFRIFRKE